MKYALRNDENGDICLTKKILDSITKKYVKVYGMEWSCFAIDIDKTVPLADGIRKIILLYFDFNFKDDKSYPQLIILNELVRLANNTINNYLIDEVKNKVINIGKNRYVFINEVEKTAKKLGYDIEKTNLLHENNSDLKMLWDCYISSNILKILTNKKIDAKIPIEILNKEQTIRDILLDYSNFLMSINIIEDKTSMIIDDKNGDILIDNDCNNIISIKESDVNFSFVQNRTYNWWFEDEAPKAVLKTKINFLQSFSVHTNINIESGFTQKNFQCGIFIRSKNQSLFCAFDSNGFFVFDEIGKLNRIKKFNFTNNFTICIHKDKELVTAIISDNKNNQAVIEWYVNSCDYLDIGLSCKTWGEIGKVKIKFYDYNLKLG